MSKKSSFSSLNSRNPHDFQKHDGNLRRGNEVGSAAEMRVQNTEVKIRNHEQNVKMGLSLIASTSYAKPTIVICYILFS